MWTVTTTDAAGNVMRQHEESVSRAYDVFATCFAKRRAWGYRRIELADAAGRLREAWEMYL